jgi:hypothetical protein
LDLDPFGTEPDPPPRTTIPHDKYYSKWRDKHGGLTPDQYKWAIKHFDYGCVGITLLNLGATGGILDELPDMTRCYTTLKQAQSAQGKCPCGNNQAKLFSTHFWSNGGAFTPDADGKVDMGPWVNDSSPKHINWHKPADADHKDKGYNYDFAWYDDDTDRWLHANHRHDPNTDDTPGHLGPMIIYSSTLEDWQDIPWDFDKEVFCIVCNGGKYGKK